MLKQFAVSELTPGMMVTRVIEQAGPMKIRKVGMIRSPDMIKGLQEMGVLLLEVDLAQSLSVEFEDLDTKQKESSDKHSSNIYSPNYIGNNKETVSKQAVKQTATQRLVASNKQIADVDRQLSQQFHRSLFLPAVDQMPSKWTLYGKPYGYLLGFVLLGLSVGWLGASAPQYWLETSDANKVMTATGEQDSTNLSTEADSTLGLDANTASGAEVAPASGSQNNKDGSSEDEKPETMAQQSTSEEDTSSAKDTNKPANETSSLAANNNNSGANASNEPDDESSRQYESVNGVILESGQQVLGYRGSDPEEETQSSLQAQLDDTKQNQRNNQQAPADPATPAEDENPVITNAPGFTTITEPGSVTNFNDDLLRRAQRAAEQVDRQPQAEPEPVLKVTDLSALPRIDQLTPAILTQMPSMSFSAHMYASNPQDRWVRVNGRRLGEGEYITDGLLIKQIESEKVVLSFRERDFTMNALTDW